VNRPIDVECGDRAALNARRRKNIVKGVVGRRDGMSDENSEAQGYGQEEEAREPSPNLKRLARLVGAWELSGDVEGTVKYEWMEGGFFLIQHVDLGPEAKGMEVIGHERPLGSEPSADVKSRFYGNTGDTLGYTYQLEGDTLTIWFGDRGSPAYYEGAFSEDGATLRGAWHYPGGGGYEAISTRVG
jgi:hypothetical protein